MGAAVGASVGCAGEGVGINRRQKVANATAGRSKVSLQQKFETSSRSIRESIS